MWARASFLFCERARISLSLSFLSSLFLGALVTFPRPPPLLCLCACLPLRRYFNETQRAELFRLKGVFLALLGQPANAAYASAATICSEYGKNWLAWGACPTRASPDSRVG